MSTVLVTGANRGLGLAFAQAYLRAGWDVLATIRGTLTGPLAKLAEANPDRLQIRQLDLDNSASIDALGAGLHGIAVDVFISNAALTGGEIGTFGQTDYERFEKCLRANTIAPLRLAERLADSVMISDRKIMFFLGSRLGAFPFFGYAGKKLVCHNYNQ